MTLKIILLFLSYALYIYAPDVYSLSFCNSVFVLFLITIIPVIIKYSRGKNYFNFHVFFLLSIFFTNFAYPLFIYPIDPEYFSVFTFRFDHDVISKATALSQVAVASYVAGVELYPVFNKKKQTIEYTFSRRLEIFTKNISLLISIVFLGYVIYTATVSPDEEVLNTQIVSILIVFLVIAIVISFLNNRHMIKNKPSMVFLKNKKILISCVLVVLACMWFGDRGPAIQIFFIGMFFYVSYVKKISLKSFLLLIAVGMFTLSMISYTRGTSGNLRSGSLSDTFSQGYDQMMSFGSFWNYGMDLIGTNRNMFVAMELKEKDGLLYGSSYFAAIFSPIPGLPYLITNATLDKTPDELSTAYIITEHTGLKDWGMGTNAVGDIYMNFGTFGVVIIFFIFGYLINKLSNQKDVFSILSYALMFGLVIYYPRASLFDQFTLIIRAIIILYFLFKISGNPKKIMKV